MSGLPLSRERCFDNQMHVDFVENKILFNEITSLVPSNSFDTRSISGLHALGEDMRV